MISMLIWLCVVALVALLADYILGMMGLDDRVRQIVRIILALIVLLVIIRFLTAGPPIWAF